MGRSLAKHIGTKETPQSEPVPGVAQVKNSAGGFVFEVDKWKRLDRFLILGTEGGTYYVGERELTIDNAKVVRDCLAEDSVRTINRIVEISESGRAPKNEPAIMALAIAAKEKSLPINSRDLAWRYLPKVCRIGTHLFHFVDYIKALGGFGRATRNALARWYTGSDAGRLALQAIKYQQRDGWSHRDVLRKAHPTPQTPEQHAILRWAVAGNNLDARTVKRKSQGDQETKYEAVGQLPAQILAFEEASKLTTKDGLSRLCALVTEHNLPHECVPNEMKQYPEVWDAMLPGMGYTAMIRNLAKMTSIGLLKPLAKSNKAVIDRLGDVEAMKRARVHPVAILVALKVYAQGKGEKGSLTWTPVPQVIDALNEAFYSAFGAIEPSGKATMVAVDVSASMSAPTSGAPALSCCEGATAMAMVTARTEPNSIAARFNTGIETFPITGKTRLDDALHYTRNINGGGTDCALPMIWALQNKIPAEVFHVITDSETWAGKIHPFQALRKYREATGIPAKLVVVGMEASKFSIADPSDAGMLDVVGFDAGVPSLMADFAR